MTNPELKALSNILDYLWEDEQKDFDASNKPKNHIFREMKILNSWYNKETAKIFGDKIPDWEYK